MSRKFLIKNIYLKNTSNESYKISLIPLKESFITNAGHLGMTKDTLGNPSRLQSTYILWSTLQYKLFDCLIVWREPGSFL